MHVCPCNLYDTGCTQPVRTARAPHMPLPCADRGSLCRWRQVLAALSRGPCPCRQCRHLHGTWRTRGIARHPHRCCERGDIACMPGSFLHGRSARTFLPYLHGRQRNRVSSVCRDGAGPSHRYDRPYSQACHGWSFCICHGSQNIRLRRTKQAEKKGGPGWREYISLL